MRPMVPATASIPRQSRRAPTTLAAAAERWLNGREARSELAPLTVASYRRSLDRLIEWAGADCPLVDITADDLEEYVAQLRPRRGGEYQPAALNTTTRGARTFFSWAARRRMIPHDPFTEVPLAQAHPSLPKRLPPEVVAALIRAADFRTSTTIMLFAHLGLRRAELGRLRVEDWDREQRTLLINGKGSRQRVLPVEGEVEQALRRWVDYGLNEAAVGPMWPSDHRPGVGLDPIWLAARVKAVGRSIGVEVHVHQLRHSCASYLVEDGADLAVVRDLLGHRNLSTTSIYVATTANHMRKHVGQRRFRGPSDDIRMSSHDETVKCSGGEIWPSNSHNDRDNYA